MKRCFGKRCGSVVPQKKSVTEEERRATTFFCIGGSESDAAACIESLAALGITAKLLTDNMPVMVETILEAGRDDNVKAIVVMSPDSTAATDPVELFFLQEDGFDCAAMTDCVVFNLKSDKGRALLQSWTRSGCSLVKSEFDLLVKVMLGIRRKPLWIFHRAMSDPMIQGIKIQTDQFTSKRMRPSENRSSKPSDRQITFEKNMIDRLEQALQRHKRRLEMLMAEREARQNRLDSGTGSQ